MSYLPPPAHLTSQELAGRKMHLAEFLSAGTKAHSSSVSNGSYCTEAGGGGGVGGVCGLGGGGGGGGGMEDDDLAAWVRSVCTASPLRTVFVAGAHHQPHEPQGRSGDEIRDNIGDDDGNGNGIGGEKWSVSGGSNEDAGHDPNRRSMLLRGGSLHEPALERTTGFAQVHESASPSLLYTGVTPIGSTDVGAGASEELSSTDDIVRALRDAAQAAKSPPIVGGTMAGGTMVGGTAQAGGTPHLWAGHGGNGTHEPDFEGMKLHRRPNTKLSEEEEEDDDDEGEDDDEDRDDDDEDDDADDDDADDDDADDDGEDDDDADDDGEDDDDEVDDKDDDGDRGGKDWDDDTDDGKDDDDKDDDGDKDDIDDDEDEDEDDRYKTRVQVGRRAAASPSPSPSPSPHARHIGDAVRAIARNLVQQRNLAQQRHSPASYSDKWNSDGGGASTDSDGQGSFDDTARDHDSNDDDDDDDDTDIS